MFKKIFFTLVLASSLVGIVGYASAVGSGPLGTANDNLNKALNDPNNPTGLSDNIANSIGVVVRGILSLAGTIFLLLTVYAGILWMTAQGSAEKIEKAQSIVTAAVIGLAITMASYAITIFVTSRVNTVSNGPASVAVCKVDADCVALNKGYTKCSAGTCQ